MFRDLLCTQENRRQSRRVADELDNQRAELESEVGHRDYYSKMSQQANIYAEVEAPREALLDMRNVEMMSSIAEVWAKKEKVGVR